MRLHLTIVPLVLLAAACQTQQETTLAGAATGAVIGAAVSDDDDRLEGALIGGAVGAVAAQLLGPANQPGQCVYRDRYGRKFVAAC